MPPAKFNPSGNTVNLSKDYFDSEYTQMSPRLSMLR